MPSLTLSINVSADSVQVWTGWVVSALQLTTRSGESRGKAVDACWLMADKAQLDTGYQFQNLGKALVILLSNYFFFFFTFTIGSSPGL